MSEFLGSLPLLSGARTRSISAENPDGSPSGGGRAVEGPGAEAARELGQGWKIAPRITLPARTRAVLADIEGPGVIQHVWLTLRPEFWRHVVLRFYWDGETSPSIEVPVGDFFCNGWGVHCDVASIPVTVAPSGGFNSYWPMPFRRRALVTVENAADEEVPAGLFYQVTYSLEEVPESAAYLHCSWRRSNPVGKLESHTILDRVEGHGHYVGTYIAWGAHGPGWWGEGEFKFFLDGDDEFPTICGTGVEDYFGGAWGFEAPDGGYATYSAPFLGLPQALAREDGGDFGMYRWHVPDPVRFEQDLRVTVQALGWGPPVEGKPRYAAREDDIASTAFWYLAP